MKWALVGIEWVPVPISKTQIKRRRKRIVFVVV